ncbi:hypothetical protein [Actinocatenispora sera]|uniref:hypothetical protein n=1 Tax=Actinocatenispora sera TaxID=390989 RepID=UPI0004C4553B|nr:hypothetical protein [Actinocatenispora sera]
MVGQLDRVVRFDGEPGERLVVRFDGEPGERLVVRFDGEPGERLAVRFDGEPGERLVGWLVKNHRAAAHPSAWLRST